MKQLYKDKICSNCANLNCTNNIQETKYQEVIVDQISTTTVVKCADFICAKKRRKKPGEWQGW